MRKTFLRTILGVLTLALLSTCTAPAAGPTARVDLTASPTTAAAAPIRVQLLYPSDEFPIVMGQRIRLTVQVTDTQGEPVNDAAVTVSVADPSGRPVAALDAQVDRLGVYRTENWPVPHRSPAGEWAVSVTAERAGATGTTRGVMRVSNSTSEDLLDRYGFWLDAPTLRGVIPSVTVELGDARSGMIRWGGVVPAQHILPQNWVDVNWRAGRFLLDTPEDVEEFLMTELNDLAFTQVRALGPFTKTRFKGWDAWKVGGVGYVARDLVEWVLFYAPEVDKTYVIGTTVTSPPPGIDPHEVLRASFEVDPANTASGVAPEPLPERLRAPELVSPPLGEQFYGPDASIVLQWEPVKELAEDEYYQVFVEYNIVEASPDTFYATRDTQFTLPETHYHLPNCFVFNWQVTLMRQTGVGEDGQPIGEEISNPSLYYYVRWNYPPGEPVLFEPFCPNSQY